MIPAVIELRQYTLKPGRRDTFVELFEREFIETQEAVGMQLIGLFIDLDDPDRFVWLRGFSDMEARKDALEAFYFGPVWAGHRAAANAGIVDSDDVLLLTPAAPGGGFKPGDYASPARSTVILAGVHALAADAQQDAPDLDRRLREALIAAGLHPLAVLVTEPAENTFPRLPVRTDAPVAVWFAAAEGQAAADAAGGPGLGDVAGPRLQTLRLAPTRRSALKVPDRRG